ncbi:PPC domain-containing protein, partial [Apibacter adventoris]
VEGYNGNFDINRCYTLKAEATAIAPCIVNYEPNDYFAKATDINTNTNYYAGIGSSADKDYYKFTLNSKSNVTVTLQNLPKNYDLIIYNIAQNQIGKSALGGTSNESITLNYLKPGTYYVVVEGYNGNFDINRCY